MKTIFKGEHYVKDVAILEFGVVKQYSKLYYKYLEKFTKELVSRNIHYDDVAPRKTACGDIDGFIAYEYVVLVNPKSEVDPD